MKMNLICGGGIAFLLLTGVLSANPVSLVVQNYNFPLVGYGGGAQALLNGQSVEIFCDNFFNDIGFTTYPSVNVTDLSTSANLDNTRFGQMNPADWTPISTGNSAANTFLNGSVGSSPLARYAMASYLVSQYNVSAGTTAANNELQMAIWTLMDPQGYSLSSYLSSLGQSSPYPSSDLVAAENWYSGIYSNTSALNTYLSAFEVVSDPNMSAPNSIGLRTNIYSFQEQIVEMHTPVVTPEPRSLGIMVGLLGLGLVLRRRLGARVSA